MTEEALTEETPEEVLAAMPDIGVTEGEVLAERLRGQDQEIRFLKDQLAAMAVQNRKLLALVVEQNEEPEEAPEAP